MQPVRSGRSAASKPLAHLHAQPRPWLLHLGSRHPQVTTQPVLLLQRLRLLHTQHAQTTLLLLVHRLG